MPQFPNTQSNVVFYTSYSYVEVKQKWNDKWTFVPYLIPITSTANVAPEVGSASLIYELGNILENEDTAFRTYAPLTLQDYYVKISTQMEGYDPEISWIGIVVDTTVTYDRNTSIAGKQTFTCYELSHLLDRVMLEQAVAAQQEYDAVDEDYVFYNRTLDILPRFNGYVGYTEKFSGNMSDVSFIIEDDELVEIDNEAASDVLSAIVDSQNNQYHLFVATEYQNENFPGSAHGKAKKWSHLDIINYLLQLYPQNGIVWTIAGQYAPLAEIYRVVDLAGKSLWEALNELIDRRRGLGFGVGFTDDGGCCIYVFTVTDKNISLQGITLPANSNQIAFNLPSDGINKMLCGNIDYATSASAQFDRIIIMGDQIRTTATFNYEYETLEEDWNKATNDDYVSAGGETDRDRADDWRARDQWDLHFASHRVPTDFDWVVTNKDADNRDDSQNIYAVANEDGSVSFKNAPNVPTYTGDILFETQTNFLRGYDYSVYPPVYRQPVDDPTLKNTKRNDISYEPIKVFILDVLDVSGANKHKPDKKWHHVEKLNESNKNLVSHDVHVKNDAAGFVLRGSPQHYFGFGTVPKTIETNAPPELDYKKLAVTATIRLPVRQKIVLTNSNPSPSEAGKTLYAIAPDCQYWYVAPSTAVDIGDDGKLKIIHPKGTVLRDDKALLQSYAAFLSAWHSTPRQAVSIPINRMGYFASLGSMLISINDLNTTQSVRTVVTSRTVDYVAQTTTLQTGFSELDKTVVRIGEEAKEHQRHVI